MSLSRAELEAMSQDELIDLIREQQQDLTRLDALLSALQSKQNNAIAQTFGQAEWDDRQADDTTTPPLADQLADLTDRVETLESKCDRYDAILTESGGKAKKVADIVELADNVSADGAAAVKLDASQIVAATGCSRRYAYDLMDDLPGEYEWFLTPQEMTQYGSLEIDNTDERRLGIDFEGVHTRGCPVNKFTTPSEGMEGSR